LAEQWRERLLRELNSDYYVSPTAVSFQYLTRAFIENREQTKGVKPSTLHEYRKMFSMWDRLCGQPLSTSLNHKMVEKYVRARRQDGAAGATINKDLRILKTLVTWGTKEHLVSSQAHKIRWEDLYQKIESHQPQVLSVEGWGALLYHANRIYGWDWVIRILLAVGTGLRQQDVERLQITDLRYDLKGIATRSVKTGKEMPLRPLHPFLLEQLKVYTEDRAEGRILRDTYHRNKWLRIIEAANLPGFKYHSLRACSGTFIALAGYSTKAVQDWLEHSTPTLTDKIYLNVSTQRRDVAESIPMEEAMETMRKLQSPPHLNPEHQGP